jgi:hypothetical protein
MMLSYCIPYYKNPLMLAEQYRAWSAYPEDLKAEIEIVLVDDGSPAPAMSVPRPDGLPPLRIYRVLTDIPWHQHGARNLAAHEADGPWLFLTDMDHVLPAESLRTLLAVLQVSPANAVYTLGRRDAPDLKVTRDQHGRVKPHVNTFAIARAWFWAIGGYDEDCVGYGTDGYFRKRLYAGRTIRRHLTDLYVVRYPREVVPDASSFCAGMDPRAFRNRGRRVQETVQRLARKGKAGPRVLDFPWERAL